MSHIDAFENAYIKAVVDEIAVAGQTVGGAFMAPTVFLGGGTPSVLSHDSLARIFEAISSHLDVAKPTEITVEMNPEDVTDELLDSLSRFGVNRISLGVQSMDASGLRTLKRCTPDVNRRALACVASHFDNFSVDLLLGIPGGSVDVVAGTVEEMLSHGPKHFSVYCLEPGGVLEHEVSDFFDRVDSEQAADEYSFVCDTLRTHGLHHYEVSNFARRGFECRHNQVYWSGDDYLGVGPGAHSFVSDRRFFNQPSIERYVQTGGGVVGKTREVEHRDQAQCYLEEVMLGLRTSQGLRLERLTCASEVVDDLETSRLAERRDGRLILTDRGFLLLNEIVDRVTHLVDTPPLIRQLPA